MTKADAYKCLLIFCFWVYVVAIIIIELQSRDYRAFMQKWPHYIENQGTPAKDRSIKQNQQGIKGSERKKRGFLLEGANNAPFYAEDVLSLGNITLEERLTCKYNKSDPPKVIYTHQRDVGSLGGCEDWNCALVFNSANEERLADAVIYSYASANINRRADHYAVYFSQESPANSYTPNVPFNMTLGFRHDSPIASPYGYTVKLAERSRKRITDLNFAIIQQKRRGAAWFVSNCDPTAARYAYYTKFKEYFSVDVYGACGDLHCARGDLCENMLDTDYHFYLAFENSICKHYITEKLWKHGYTHYVVPIVLKREIVEQFAPPYSFIAADDFRDPADLAKYLKYLMENKTAYLEYFMWRLDYHVVFLDGVHHDKLERPWGLCQLCRLLWESPRKRFVIEDMKKHWTESCDI